MNRLLLVVSVILLLTGCGGGGTSSASNNVSSSNSSNGSLVDVAPNSLSYTSPATLIAEEQIAALNPTVTGPVISYSVTPALPAGLSLNTTTGQITGTPTTATGTGIYTITAQNAAGLTTFHLSIVVNPPFPSTPPSAPTVNVSYGAKQVTLNWHDAEGATAYRILKQPTKGAGYTELATDITANDYTDNVSVHLSDWINASYRVEACNFYGCTASSAITGLDDTQATGYFKAPNIDENTFGYSVALSADGTTLAIGAPEPYRFDFLFPIIDPNAESGTVYVFTHSDNIWSLQAAIKASNTKAYDRFGTSVSLSADGTTMAVGANLESSSATGINAPQAESSTQDAGAAYVFIQTDNTWEQQAYIKATNTQQHAQFGHSVVLSEDGDTLAVGAIGESNQAIGINGDQTPNTAFEAGAAYVFTRHDNTWSQQATIKGSNTGEGHYFGADLALSTDGDILAVGAPGEISNASGSNGDSDYPLVPGSGAVYLFTRHANQWSQQAHLTATNAEETSGFGNSVALSSDGATLAVGAAGITEPVNGTRRHTATAHVLTHTDNTWSQQAYLTAPYTERANGFGVQVALSADGTTLAVGAPLESSNATGINGQQTEDLAEGSGTVYLFTHQHNTWAQQATVNAIVTGNYYLFGESMALSADGTTMAVGAPGEGMTITDIDDDQEDNPVHGAAYLY